MLKEDILNLNIDVCIVTETFLRPSIPDSFVKIDGFVSYRRDRKICYCRKSDCAKVHRGGGVMVFVTDSLTSEIFDISNECESLWIKITNKLRSNEQLIFINASYHRPGTSSSELRSYITKVSEAIEDKFPKSLIVVGGDFNRMASDFREHGLTTLESPPTRLEARLDLLLTNMPDIFDSVSSFKSKLETDHLGLIARPKHKLRPVRWMQEFRLFSFAGHRRFNTLISECDFSEVYDKLDVNEAACCLESMVKNCFEKAYPMKKVRMSSRDPKWITPKIKWLLNRKHRAHKKCRIEKRIYYDERIKSAKLNSLKQLGSKSWWSKIDTLTHRKVTNKSIMENSFVPEQLNRDLAKRSDRKDLEVDISPPFFNIKDKIAPELSMNEVSQIIRRCKRTSCGPSGIPYFIFRQYWDILTPLYHHVWNNSLKVGIFPDIYKAADLIPIPKTNNAKNSNDIRGISVTSIAARLFEKAVHKRWIAPGIVTIGDPYQFAYKPGLSTIDCLLSLQHFVMSNLDLPGVDAIHGVFIDLSKAFDCVNQEIAARQYQMFIDSVYVQKWLYNFTIERKQRLIWKNEPCQYLPIQRGCSQGTVGGPGIFSIYTDDLRSVTPYSCIFKYSDDTNCAIPCMKDPSEVDKDQFRKELNNVFNWAKEKNQEINLSKSNIMRFSLNHKPICKCRSPEQVLNSVNETKILGIIFQSDCSFRKHTQSLLSHLRAMLYLFKDLKLNDISIEEIDKVFHSLIISRIRYGLSVYGSDASSLRKIDRFLRRCFEKNLCKSRILISDLLQSEDLRNARNILANPHHPLHQYLTTHRKLRTTRHLFQSVRPQTRTKAFHAIFSNRVLSYPL